MRFLFLIHHTAEAFDAMTPEEHHAMQTGSADFDDWLAEHRHLVLAHALRDARDGKAVKVRGRRKLVSDGPYTETKEQLVGFVLVEAGDMDEAVALAARLPLAATGTVEVREAYQVTRDMIRSPRP